MDPGSINCYLHVCGCLPLPIPGMEGMDEGIGMKTKKAIEIMWQHLEKSVPNLRRDLDGFINAISERNPDEAGELIKELLREILESYTRLGVIGALELIE